MQRGEVVQTLNGRLSLTHTVDVPATPRSSSCLLLRPTAIPGPSPPWPSPAVSEAAVAEPRPVAPPGCCSKHRPGLASSLLSPSTRRKTGTDKKSETPLLQPPRDHGRKTSTRENRPTRPRRVLGRRGRRLHPRVHWWGHSVLTTTEQRRRGMVRRRRRAGPPCGEAVGPGGDAVRPTPGCDGGWESACTYIHGERVNGHD